MYLSFSCSPKSPGQPSQIHLWEFLYFQLLHLASCQVMLILAPLSLTYTCSLAPCFYHPNLGLYCILPIFKPCCKLFIVVPLSYTYSGSLLPVNLSSKSLAWYLRPYKIRFKLITLVFSILFTTLPFSFPWIAHNVSLYLCKSFIARKRSSSFMKPSLISQGFLC